MKGRTVAAFGVGVVVGMVVTLIRFVRPEIRARHRAEIRAADPRSSQARQRQADDAPAWTCGPCNRAFHDDESARRHAVGYHDAPKTAELWKHTYTASD